MTVGVRALATRDEPSWRPLWQACLAFYETVLADEVFGASVARMTDPGVPDHHGLIADHDGRAIGLAYVIFHRHGWQIAEVTSLQDLFVAPEARGSGIGRRLIEAVHAAADAAGRPDVSSMTQDFTATARRLHDRIGTANPFITYRR